jgi:hypothetical protein
LKRRLVQAYEDMFGLLNNIILLENQFRKWRFVNCIRKIPPNLVESKNVENKKAIIKNAEHSPSTSHPQVLAPSPWPSNAHIPRPLSNGWVLSFVIKTLVFWNVLSLQSIDFTGL